MNLVGEMGLEFKDVDEGFVEPLTISQIKFCLFNEADDERAFWSKQPDGSEADGEGDLVGEMAGAGPQNSPASPEGPCWFCGAPGQVKRSCPARLKAVHSKAGGSASPSRGGRDGRSYQCFEEVCQEAPRRGRPPPRNRASTAPSSRQTTDSRRGIFPVRERRVGEISDTVPEEDSAPPEEGELDGEVGGLYDSQYDQAGF